MFSGGHQRRSLTTHDAKSVAQRLLVLGCHGTEHEQSAVISIVFYCGTYSKWSVTFLLELISIEICRVIRYGLNSNRVTSIYIFNFFIFAT